MAPLFDKSFIVIAHRGASYVAPENTMPSFKHAVDVGADMIETDVQLSKDKIPVLFHDEKLNKHSNEKGYLSDYTLEELRNLDAGGWFSRKYSGTKIPTLQELLDWADKKILLNLEIKTEAVSEKISGGIEERVIEMVKSTGLEKHVLLSSFDYRAMNRFKQIDSEIKTGLLFNKRTSGKLGPVELVRKYKADAFHCSNRQLKNRWVKDLNNQNVPFFIYTVNRKRTMKKWIKKGAYGLFTDNPELLKSTVTEFND